NTSEVTFFIRKTLAQKGRVRTFVLDYNFFICKLGNESPAQRENVHVIQISSIFGHDSIGDRRATQSCESHFNKRIFLIEPTDEFLGIAQTRVTIIINNPLLLRSLDQSLSAFRRGFSIEFRK